MRSTKKRKKKARALNPRAWTWMSAAILKQVSRTDSPEEFEADDSLVGLFQEVKRTQMKYKCIFVNCILHIRGKDIIVPKMSADIDY